MVGHVSSDDQATSGKRTPGRAPWITPRVIVSDLGDAKAGKGIIPGGDGCDPAQPTYCYGS